MTEGAPLKPDVGLSGNPFKLSAVIHGFIPNARVFPSGRRDLAWTVL